ARGARLEVLETTVDRAFSLQARASGEVVALTFGGRSWSYAELDDRVNRLAWCLRSRGVGPERLVGICLERSPDLATAALAVLKTGAAYLPLDPSHPAERLRSVLE